MSYTIHYYDSTARKIVRTRSYATRALAQAALRRAAKRRQIAIYAGLREATNPPTTHS
jgi:hypothetical protein